MFMKKRIIKTICMLSLVTSISVLSREHVSYADRSVENELKLVIEKYDESIVDIQEGIAIRVGESLDLSKNPNWEISNNKVAKIENGKLIPIKEGTVFLSQEIKGKAYIIEVYVFENEPVEPVNNKVNRDYYKVFIDPGHGGSDPGNTAGATNGITEKVINLQVSNLVKQKLESKGIEVKMSRTGDTYPSLEERSKMANSYGADVFVSIHQNSAGSTSANGIETFYHSDKSKFKPLSTDVQNSLIKQTSAKSRGVKHNNFAVLRLSTMSSALVECGFMTNTAEYSKLTNSSYQDKLATGIADGIEQYLKRNIILGNTNIINTGTITTKSLNVRAGYGSNYDVIGTLSKGSKVDIVETKNGWHKIIFDGRYGYVSGDYVNIDSTNQFTEKQLNVISKFEQFCRYSENDNLTDSSKVIKTYSQASNILRKTEQGEVYDRQKFLDAWNELSATEKSHPDMKKIQNEYRKIISVVEASQAILKLYEDAIDNSGSMVSNSEYAKSIYSKENMSLGARGRANKEYVEATKYGENSNNSSRMSYINDKYLDTLNFLEVCIYLSDFEIDKAKTEASKIKDSKLKQYAYNHISNYEGKQYTNNQKNTIKMFEQFYIYGEMTNPIVNLSLKSDVIKKSSDATNILKKVVDGKKYDRQKFLDAWAKMSNKEKSHQDMKEIQSDYLKIISITEAAEACLKFYENVSLNANNLMNNSDLVNKLYDKNNMTLGARGKAYKEYNEATKYGESSKNSSRMSYINEKYLDSVNFLETAKHLAEGNKEEAVKSANKIKNVNLKQIANTNIK